MNRPSNLHRVIHGRIIELANDPGLKEGQEVEVTVRTASTVESCGEGLRRAAGALADSWQPEDDEILDRIERNRMRSASRRLP